MGDFNIAITKEDCSGFDKLEELVIPLISQT